MALESRIRRSGLLRSVPEGVGGEWNPSFERCPLGKAEVPADGGAVEDAAALFAGRQGNVLGGLAVVESPCDHSEKIVDRGLHSRSEVPRAGLSAAGGSRGRFDQAANADVVAGLAAV